MVRLYEYVYNMEFLESMHISMVFIIYDISSFGLIPLCVWFTNDLVICYEMDHIVAGAHTTHVRCVRYTYGFVSMNCSHNQGFTMVDKVPFIRYA